jgi:hypothetical protein
MNNIQLLKEMIKRKIVKEGTVINATVRANGIGGQVVDVPKNVGVTIANEKGIIAWERDYAGRDHEYKVKLTDVHNIEGMDIARMAKAYKIKLT